MFNLVVFCIYSYALLTAKAGVGYTTTLSNPNPVRVGGNATLNCTVYPDSVRGPLDVSWHLLMSSTLRLRQGNGTSCIVLDQPKPLRRYTLKHTCDTENNHFTLTIVNVTERDISQDGWCCVTHKTDASCRFLEQAPSTISTSAPTTTKVKTEPRRIRETTENPTSHSTIPGPSCQLWIVIFAVFIMSEHF